MICPSEHHTIAAQRAIPNIQTEPLLNQLYIKYYSWYIQGKFPSKFLLAT